MKERYCRNCVDGQDVGSRFSLASWVYCSFHRRYKRYYDVCPDHRFVEEVFDLDSPTPFTDWVKKQGVRTLPKSCARVKESCQKSGIIMLRAWKP